jgi:hypothetical protein
MIQSLQAQKQPQDDGYTDQPYYDEYKSSVVERTGDPPNGFDTWDDWQVTKCKAAQKLIDDVAAANQKIGAQLTSGILITFSTINLLLTLTVISIPISIVLQIVATLVAIGANYAYAAVVDWLIEHKESLVCAIYTASTVSEAYSAVQAYIAAEWDVSTPSDIVSGMLSYLVLSDIFDGTIRDYDLWQADYDDDYCLLCEEIPTQYLFEWIWPPCPNGSFMDGGICYDGRLSFNGDSDPAHYQFYTALSPFNRVQFSVKWRSALGSTYTVGIVALDRWDPGTTAWIPIAGFSTTNNAGVGELNITSGYSDLDPDESSDLYRWRVQGAAGQHEEDPYPLMLEYISTMLQYIP